VATQLATLADASAAVSLERGRLKKRDRLVACLRGLDEGERRAAIAWLSGTTLQGKIGVGYRELSRVDGATATEATLTIGEVDAALNALARISGVGSAAKRRDALGALFARATAAERTFLFAVLTGGLRQGGLEGVMIEAVAVAAEVDTGALRRAVMLAGDLPGTAALAMKDKSALAAIEPKIFTAIEPMLASPSETLELAIGELSKDRPALVEWKLDGARVQVHRDGDEVRIFTRALQDVTTSVPEAMEVVRTLPARRLILDGEAIALHPDGRPRPFQESQSRFAKKRDITTARAAVPLSVFFFDALVVDDVLIDRPLAERRAALHRVLPATHQLPSIETSDVEAARVFYEHAIARGHEGVLVKSMSSTYAAGARGASWQKVKRVHTLDLVVLAAEWGSGRRKGTLSNLHLGARDPSGGYVMLGKTFKGMTDAILDWQTKQLLAREVRRDAYTVYVRPELVAEFAFDGVQQSPTYEGGYALRFARLVRYRDDKTVEQANTIDDVRRIFGAARASLI
jgi:DNA ligase-1